MRRFYRSLDLSALFETFADSMTSTGHYRYPTAYQLAISKGVNQEQKDFLIYLLGPDPGDPDLALRFAGIQPLDFDKKRKTGKWFTSENVRAHSEAIRREINALDALREAGNRITVNSLVRMENLARQLDADFGGRFFVDGLSHEENMRRAKTYIDLHTRLLHLIGEAQDIYAKSHGINFADMSGFERLLAAQALTLAAQHGGHESKAGQVLDKIVQMTLEKHAEHKIPLPATIENVVVMDGKPIKKDKNVM